MCPVPLGAFVRLTRLHCDGSTAMFTGRYRLIDRFVRLEHKGYCLLINSFYPRNRYLLPASLKAVLDYFALPRDQREACAFVCERYGASHPDWEQIIEKVISDLIRMKILVPLEFNEWRRLDVLRRFKERDARISTLYIVPTLRCNLACKYCFILQNRLPSTKRKRVAWKTVTRAVDHFFDQYAAARRTRCRPMVIFYGGEPLMERELVGRIAKYILASKQRYGITRDIELVLTTNGTLLDRKAIGMVARYGIKVAVSFDGVPEHTNSMRRDCGGRTEGVATRVLRGIRLLEEANIPHGISMTLWRHNQDYRPGLRWIAEHLKTRDIGFNFYHPFLTESGQKHVQSMYTRAFMRRLIRDTAKMGFRFVQLVADKYLFDRCLPVLEPCPVSQGQMVVHPDGYVGNCHATLGSKTDFINWDGLPRDLNTHDLWRRERRNGPLYRRDCYLKCDYFTVCGGGCMYDAEVLYGSRFATNPTYCNLTKASMQVFAEKLIDRHLAGKGGPDPC